MGQAKVSMMMGQSLTKEEQAKLDLVGDGLAIALGSAGCPVRVCSGEGDGPARMIGFGLFGPPVATLPASDFLAKSEHELLAMIQDKLQNK